MQSILHHNPGTDNVKHRDSMHAQYRQEIVAKIVLVEDPYTCQKVLNMGARHLCRAASSTESSAHPRTCLINNDIRISVILIPSYG